MPLPCAKVTLCRYIVFLARTLSFTTVKCYLNIIRIIHKEVGLDNPLDCYSIKSLLRGVHRQIGVPPKQKLPITMVLLRQILSVLDLSISFNKAFWAASLVAFYSFLRKSSLVLKNAKSFDPLLHLCRESVSFVDRGAILNVRHTKTIQCHNRELNIPIPFSNQRSMCPVYAILYMFMSVGSVSKHVPLFIYKDNDSVKTLTHSSFVKALKSILNVCGYDPSCYSGHSFRRGGASHAFKCKIPETLIKLQGDWKSSAYMRYIDIPLDVRWNMMANFANN